MTNDDIRKALQDVKSAQAAEFEAVHLKLDAILSQREQAVEMMAQQADRMSGMESGWINTFKGQSLRINALESRITALEGN